MPDPPRASIRLSSEVQEATALPGALLLKRAAAAGLKEIRSASCPTSTRPLDELGPALVGFGG